MFCVLCRCLMKFLDPGWIEKAERLHDDHLLSGLNEDAMFGSDADPARLREIYELSRSDPAAAFAQFLPLAEAGSVWSMIRIGYAYQVGRGVRVDLGQAEQWYTRAYEKGSDYGLVQGSTLAFRRGDPAKAKAMLNDGVARGLARAMTNLAWLELKRSHGEQAHGRARSLYEQAIAMGDFDARMSFASAMAHGQFGLREIPTGMRNFYRAAKDFSSQVDAKGPARSAGNWETQ